MLTDKDECSDPNVCLNGVCQNYRGGYQCSCNPGFVATENMTQCVGKNQVLIIIFYQPKSHFILQLSPGQTHNVTVSTFSQSYVVDIMPRQKVLTCSQHTVDICGESNFGLLDKPYEML